MRRFRSHLLPNMDVQKVLHDHSFILTEAAVIESLRRSGEVELHPRLEHALLIYDDHGRGALSRLYQDFISIAHNAGVPIFIGTPTWRADHERLATANIIRDVNGDAVRFLMHLKEEWGPWAENIFVGGLIGCKNDCYNPDEGLSREDAEAFHVWQVDRLARAHLDFLLAATIPSVPEAAGIALAMAKTDIPYILSFVINREGHVLDGNSLEHAFGEIDAICSNPPLGYMINCAHPSFLRPHERSKFVFSRLIGFQANASSLDHSKLNRAKLLQADSITDWGDRMIELNTRFGVQILGGCCGTDCEHLQYIVRKIVGKRDPETSS